jgi:hypothetical protein
VSSPTPADLIDAPQLAALAMLASAIRITRSALLAEHTELLADDRPLSGQSPDRTTRIAERLLRSTSELSAALRDYRSAAISVIELEHDDFETDPF